MRVSSAGRATGFDPVGLWFESTPRSHFLASFSKDLAQLHAGFFFRTAMTRKWVLTRTQADFLIEILESHKVGFAMDLKEELEVLFGYQKRYPIEEFNEAKLKAVMEAIFKNPFPQPIVGQPDSKHKLYWIQ